MVLVEKICSSDSSYRNRKTVRMKRMSKEYNLVIVMKTKKMFKYVKMKTTPPYLRYAIRYVLAHACDCL